MRRGRAVPAGWLVAADCLVAVGLAAFALVRTSSGPWFLWVAILGLAAGVGVRRVRPAGVFGGEVVLAVGAVLLGVPGDVVVIAVALVLYPLARNAGVWQAAVAAGGALAAVVVPGLLTATVPGLPVVAAPAGEESFGSAALLVVGYCVVVVGGAWALARVLRARRDHAAELARLRERHAVSEERLRIARDVHDIVGHSLGVIAMKAAVAEHLAADRSASLRAIEQISRDALADVRTVLGTLREPEETRAGLDELPRLVANAEASGLAVTLERVGYGQVPAAVQASAFRIVQEALTNAVRHASPRRCTLRLEQTADSLVITATNPTAHTSHTDGYGLLGVRERVVAHGGRLSVAGDAGRFVLRADLPLDAGERP